MTERAELYMKIRWVGVPFFSLGVIWIFLALQHALQTGEYIVLMASTASCLMGLTCFGLNHDTAIEMALQIREEDPSQPLGSQTERELKEEMARDMAQALAITGHPKLAFFIPVLTLSVHGLVVWMLF
jgi:hypothetical protein